MLLVKSIKINLPQDFQILIQNKMKTQNKVRILMLSVVGILMLMFLGYQYVRYSEGKVFFKAKLSGDEQIIDKVMQFKTESFLKPTKDNAGWDDMVTFIHSKDTAWGNENMQAIKTTFGMSSIIIFDKQGNELLNVNNPREPRFKLTKPEILYLFKNQKTCHWFLGRKDTIIEYFGATIVPTIDVYRNTPASGFLVTSKIWDSAYLSEMNKATGSDIKLLPVSGNRHTQNNKDDETILRFLKDGQGDTVAVLKFSNKNQFAAELSNIGLKLIIGILALIILVSILFILTSKWITIPLKNINDSLLNEETTSLKKLLHKPNEFGQIARLINQFNLQKNDLVNEINEKLEAEKALTASKEFAEMIYKVTPSAIFTVDADKRITSWNHKAEVITGFTTAEMIGQSCSIFTDSPCDTGCGLYNSKIPKPINAKECVIRHKSGERIFIIKNVDLLKDLNGNIIGGIESFEDISIRKNVERDLEKAKEDAEKATLAKSDFLAIMSHEIRTPVNGVIGMTELTLTTQLTHTQREYLEGVQTSAYALLDVINDILDFSKIEAGKLQIENTEFNIRQVIERSVDILNVKAFIKNIELLYEIEPSLPEIFIGDSVRIRQILINLISNALKFTEKGEICITVKCLSENVGINHSMIVQFSVKDTGIGIPDDKKELIFESFTQADVSTTRKFGGTGLGLSISKRLTELMNGTITLESEENLGSTFTFEIPLQVSPNQVTEKSSQIINIRKVLLVDDNATNLKIMHDILGYWGIDSAIAFDGPQALDLLNQSKSNGCVYDLVILDMHMPGMDGLAVAAKIREELELPAEPVILMLSSMEKDNIKELGTKAGIDRFLTKPVKMKDFYELLIRINDNVRESDRNENLVVDDFSNTLSHRVILIADDNRINLELLNVLLARTGAEIHKATNGAEAVEIFKAKKPELIFMDVYMPVINGFDATKMIRAIEGDSKHTPVVALTANAMEGDREKCISMGMDNYLPKPYKPIDLYSMAHKYLHSAKQVTIASKHIQTPEIENEKYDKEEFISINGLNNEIFNEIITDFKRLFPEYFQQLKEAIREEDYEKIDFQAHALKGMCGSIMAKNLRDISWRIEVLAKTPGSLEEIEVCAFRLKNAYNEMLPYLEA